MGTKRFRESAESGEALHFFLEVVLDQDLQLTLEERKHGRVERENDVHLLSVRVERMCESVLKQLKGRDRTFCEPEFQAEQKALHLTLGIAWTRERCIYGESIVSARLQT